MLWMWAVCVRLHLLCLFIGLPVAHNDNGTVLLILKCIVYRSIYSLGAMRMSFSKKCRSFSRSLIRSSTSTKWTIAQQWRMLSISVAHSAHHFHSDFSVNSIKMSSSLLLINDLIFPFVFWLQHHSNNSLSLLAISLFFPFDLSNNFTNLILFITKQIAIICIEFAF